MKTTLLMLAVIATYAYAGYVVRAQLQFFGKAAGSALAVPLNVLWLWPLTPLLTHIAMRRSERAPDTISRLRADAMELASQIAELEALAARAMRQRGRTPPPSGPVC